MKRTCRHLVWDILENARDACQYTTSVSDEHFFRDSMRQKAVVRCLEVIGEAAKRIPADIQERFAHIPWSDMAKTRDKLIHDYAGIDLILLKTIVEESLAPLLPHLEEMFHSLSPDD